MRFPIEEKLVIAISSSAVFDMHDADTIFREEGEEAYRIHQKENLYRPFEPGPAFPFIRRLLHLNHVYPDKEPVEVIVLSRNDPNTGQRFFESCKHYNLKITRGAFLCGNDPWPYVESFSASLFLSANENDVREAIAAGMPAGLVLPTCSADEKNSNELRIAFDFDGVLASDEAECVYRSSGLDTFHESESTNAALPLSPGPLHSFAKKLSAWQKFEMERKKENPEFEPLLRVAIVTARNAPSHARFIRTLEEWGLSATETFFMGGIVKSRVLRVFKPHLFLDDQVAHFEDIAREIPCAHIPFGIVNRPSSLS